MFSSYELVLYGLFVGVVSGLVVGGLLEMYWRYREQKKDKEDEVE